MQAMTPISPLEAGVEMFQRGKLQPFLHAPTRKPRPLSEATEIVDTDFEDESEFEEDSPKYSFESNEGRRSQTTISTFDEVSTPKSARRNYFDLQIDTTKPVEGPRGPHLFRSSRSSWDSTFDYALQMSPLLPKEEPPVRISTAFRETGFSPVTVTELPFTNFPSARAELDRNKAQSWTPQQVADWMYGFGMEESVIERFENHDITGAVLLDLQFDDLKELGIQSFGKRHQLWNQIEILRGGDGTVSPAPTPFQDISRPCTGATRAKSVRERSRARDPCNDTPVEEGVTPITPGGGRRRRGRKHHHVRDDVITPAESVSIVAIEQLLPKPHKCPRGERCAKWRKQQRLIKRVQEEHGFPISPEKGGHIFIAGDPGNAATAAHVVENVYRPVSEAVPSVVASSDVLGPGQLPAFALQEDLLRNMELRDPQENVKQFLTLQHVDPPRIPTPEEEDRPLEMFPPLHPPHQTPAPHTHLKSLPKLSIPRSASANPYQGPASANRSAVDTAFSCRSATASPGVYRFGTPCSEADVPVTAIPLGPISRNESQSVPPNMQFRDPIARSTSRGEWRRPSFALPALAEGKVFSPQDETNHVNIPQPGSQINAVGEQKTATTTKTKKPSGFAYENVNHAGWMKKRKTKLLRHEWQEQHFRLTGTRLAMHPNALPSSAALDTIDVDDYAVACSSLASNKLAAKLKSLRLVGGASSGSTGAGGNGKDAEAAASAFSFQLVPAGKEGEEARRVRRAVAGGKTHHFAVKTRDERIDWMRELMLAKALRAKGEGFEVQVNGSAM